MPQRKRRPAATASERAVVAVSRPSGGPASALLGAALALPGMAPGAQPGYRSEELAVSYHHAGYRESGDRMEVDVDQLSVTAPIGERFEGKLNLIQDVTSGASPTLNGASLLGKPFQMLQSGASIRDTREVIDASLGYYGEQRYASVRAGRSREDDYISNFGSVEYRSSLAEDNIGLTLSAAVEDDEAWNSAKEDSLLTPPHEDRRKYDFLLGINRLLDKNSLIEANLTYSHSTGDLSDPYKKVYVSSRDPLRIVPLFGSALGGGSTGGFVEFLPFELTAAPSRLINRIGIYDDTRPAERDQWIALVRYSRYLDGSDSAVHMDYRLALDDWGTDSHTLELRWNKDLGRGWLLSTGLRYYSQHSADFYRVSFDRLPSSGLMSSDYRLAGFGAASAEIGLAKTLMDGRLTLRLNYERYERRKALELGDSRGDELDNYSADLLGVTIEGVF
jgi:hypothetical protein